MPGAAAVTRASTRRSSSPRGPAESNQASISSEDRKSTRLNSSHANISYAVFCLKINNLFPSPNLYPCAFSTSPVIFGIFSHAHCLPLVSPLLLLLYLLYSFFSYIPPSHLCLHFL